MCKLLPTYASHQCRIGPKRQVLTHVDCTQRFDLDLEPFAPYKIDYSREGTYLLMGGKKGHLALLDWRKNKLLTEVHVKETVRDVKYTPTLFSCGLILRLSSGSHSVYLRHHCR